MCKGVLWFGLVKTHPPPALRCCARIPAAGRIAVMMWEEGSIIGLRYFVLPTDSEAPSHHMEVGWARCGRLHGHLHVCPWRAHAHCCWHACARIGHPAAQSAASGVCCPLQVDAELVKKALREQLGKVAEGPPEPRMHSEWAAPAISR